MISTSLPSGARIQKIGWMNPQSNEYEEDTSFEARIEDVDFGKFQLSHEEEFPRTSMARSTSIR